jgi:hypothetical protein
MANIIANFKNGERAYVRTITNSRYENGKLMACHKVITTKRRSLAANIPTIEADDWVNDGHNKTGWMTANNIHYMEVVE